MLSYSVDPETAADLWVLPLHDVGKPFPFLRTRFEERRGQFSPDGRWVAYQSGEAGQEQIYVRPFPGSDGQWQISTSGGTQPRWRRDGRELYYISSDNKLMAVPIAVNGSGLKPGSPVTLFQPRILGGRTRPQYDVAPDGRFLINVVAEDATTLPITVLLNWKPSAN